jgi:[acyl-carrier-protein] S-malonyltransferase
MTSQDCELAHFVAVRENRCILGVVTTAFIFPGQGSQAIGMGKALAQKYAVARDTFLEADSTLGEKLSKLCFEGPAGDLELTANSQPAILTTSIAYLRVLQNETSLRATHAAGHSLGEYSALVCAGAMTFAEAVRLVRRRGQLMQSAVSPGSGAMAAIMGLDAATLETICSELARGEIVAPANYNGAGQIVIAGSIGAVKRVSERVEEVGGTAIALKVSAPFHCSLMTSVGDSLRAELEKIRFRKPEIEVVANVDAQRYGSETEVVDKLVRQVSAPVRWSQSIEALVAQGVDTFYELGHGGTLTRLLKREHKQLKLQSPGADDFAALAAALPVNQASTAKPSVVSERVTFAQLLERYGAKPHDIYRWMMLKQLPTALIDGVLTFDEAKLAAWEEKVGGIEAVKAAERAAV